MRQALQDTDADILLAIEGDTLAGMLTISRQRTKPYACMVQAEYAFVLDLITAPAFRRQGAASALLAAADSWALERGLEYVELCVLEGNGAAQALYKSVGYNPTRHLLRRRLPRRRA